MARPDLERTAYTVECFLNALRLIDGAERTRIEAILTRWLSAPAHREDEFAVYSSSRIECRSRGKEINVLEVPKANQDKALWCNGSQIEIIDGDEFQNSRRLVMLGVAGLDFSMPVAEERLSSETI